MLAGRVTTDILHTVKKKVCVREKQTDSKMNRNIRLGQKIQVNKRKTAVCVLCLLKCQFDIKQAETNT